MKTSTSTQFMLHSSRNLHVVAVLICTIFLSTPTLGAQPSNETEPTNRKVVAQKQVEKTIPGTYHYESQYEMRKDGKGNYSSTYESQKNKWFCCMDWFSSEKESSAKAEKS